MISIIGWWWWCKTQRSLRYCMSLNCLSWFSKPYYIPEGIHVSRMQKYSIKGIKIIERRNVSHFSPDFHAILFSIITIFSVYILCALFRCFTNENERSKLTWLMPACTRQNIMEYHCTESALIFSLILPLGNGSCFLIIFIFVITQ